MRKWSYWVIGKENKDEQDEVGQATIWLSSEYGKYMLDKSSQAQVRLSGDKMERIPWKGYRW